MSIFYWLLIERVIGGYFELGRLVDLLQKDLIILFLVLIMCYCRRITNYEKWRWERLTKKDLDIRD